MRAPVWISLAAGLIVGALAQRTRLCMVGGIRDVLLFKDWTLLAGFAAILAAALVSNAVLNTMFGGYFKVGFNGPACRSISMDFGISFPCPLWDSALSCSAAARCAS